MTNHPNRSLKARIAIFREIWPADKADELERSYRHYRSLGVTAQRAVRKATRLLRSGAEQRVIALAEWEAEVASTEWRIAEIDYHLLGGAIVPDRDATMRTRAEHERYLDKARSAVVSWGA